MFKKDIYKYKDEKGRTVISPYKPSCEYEHMYRLIAQSEDYRLTNYTIFAQCIDVQEKDLELWFEVHKDDLETPISQNEEVKQSIEEIKSVNSIQDEIIDMTMLALDEMFEMFEPMLSLSIKSMSLNNKEVTNPMVELYVVMIQRGLKTIDQVPARYREEVKAILDAIEK